MSITKENKHELMKEYATSNNDTGSVDVQCAVLTERIKALTSHMNSNKKDYQARRGLLVLVNRRRKLMKYLKNNDAERHEALRQKLGMRK